MYGIKDYCDPYLTEQQYNKIKSISDSKTYAHANDVYIFSQLLKCPECGSNMTGFVKRQKLSNGCISMYKRYRCAKKFHYSHNSPCITESVVEDYMIHNILQELDHKICNLRATQKVKKKTDQTLKIKAEMSRLNLLFQKGRIQEEYYDQQYSLLEEKLKKESEQQNIVQLESYKAIQKNFTGNWLDLYNGLDALHKRAFWKRVIKAIYIDKDTHKLSGFDFWIEV